MKPKNETKTKRAQHKKVKYQRNVLFAKVTDFPLFHSLTLTLPLTHTLCHSLWLGFAIGTQWRAVACSSSSAAQTIRPGIRQSLPAI